MLPKWEADTAKGIKFVWFLIATCLRFGHTGSADIPNAEIEAGRVATKAKQIFESAQD